MYLFLYLSLTNFLLFYWPFPALISSNCLSSMHHWLFFKKTDKLLIIFVFCVFPIALFDAGLNLGCFRCRYIGVNSVSHLCDDETAPITHAPAWQQCEHELKRWFYSPNVQSKIIIESQTSTVKIQHRLRYRGPLLENGLSPNKMYMFFFQ